MTDPDKLLSVLALTGMACSSSASGFGCITTNGCDDKPIKSGPWATPGETITYSDGKQCRVADDGSLRRIKP